MCITGAQICAWKSEEKVCAVQKCGGELVENMVRDRKRMKCWYDGGAT